MRLPGTALLLTLLATIHALSAANEDAGWQSLFDGQSLSGWEAGEHPGSFKVVDGAIACDGPRAHLFYLGAEGKATFRNFEFEAEVMTRPGANSGIYFHTARQGQGWPDQGLEVQINNTQPPRGDYYETKKTGSLYGLRNQYKAIVSDNAWFRIHLAVRGRVVQIRVNDRLVVDYVFTDSMTYTDDQGRRMRLWMEDEVFVEDPQTFMETLVNRAVGILSEEPIDVYVNPTFLPDVIAAEYDTLWTEARMQRVIDAAVKHQVAIEINARYRLPSPRFIKLAKKAGARFTFGTNNGDRRVGDLDYCLAMVRECALTWQDLFIPPSKKRR